MHTPTCMCTNAHMSMFTTHCQMTGRLQWSLALISVYVCKSLPVCVANMGRDVHTDGRLDDGRLVQTGFPALPLFCLLSPFLTHCMSLSFFAPYINRRESPCAIKSSCYLYRQCSCLQCSTPLGCLPLFPDRVQELAVKLERNANFLPHWHSWLSVSVGFWCFDS